MGALNGIGELLLSHVKTEVLFDTLGSGLMTLWRVHGKLKPSN